jgi:hypothetical protein
LLVYRDGFAWSCCAWIIAPSSMPLLPTASIQCRDRLVRYANTRRCFQSIWPYTGCVHAALFRRSQIGGLRAPPAVARLLFSGLHMQPGSAKILVFLYSSIAGNQSQRKTSCRSSPRLLDLHQRCLPLHRDEDESNGVGNRIAGRATAANRQHVTYNCRRRIR